jgi:hypothetical protein
MARKERSTEEIIAALREAEVRISQGENNLLPAPTYIDALGELA